jgi:hypothetical protein
LFLSANLWELDLKTFILKKSLKNDTDKDETVTDYNKMILRALMLAEKKRIFLMDKAELLREKIKQMLEPFIKRKIRYKR